MSIEIPLSTRSNIVVMGPTSVILAGQLYKRFLMTGTTKVDRNRPKLTVVNLVTFSIRLIVGSDL